MESCRVTLRYLKSDPRPNSYANLVSPFPYVCVLKEHRLLFIFHHYYLFCCSGCGKRARKCLICQAEPPSLLCLPQTPALLCSPKASGAGDTLAAPWGHLGPPSPAPARSGCTVWQPESWGWCQRGARRPPAPSPAMTIPCFVCPGSEMRGEWKVRQLPTGTGRDAARWHSHPVHTSCSQCRGCSPASLLRGLGQRQPRGFLFQYPHRPVPQLQGMVSKHPRGGPAVLPGQGHRTDTASPGLQGTSSSQTHEEQTPCKPCPRRWPCSQEQPALCVPASSALVSPPGGLLAALHHPALVQSKELGQIGGHQASTTSLCHAALSWGQTALQRTSAPSSVVLQGRFLPYCVHDFSGKSHSADARSHLPGAASVLEDAGWPHATSSTSSTRPQHLHRAWALAVCDTRDGQTATPI